jgi:hypothetical protein
MMFQPSSANISIPLELFTRPESVQSGRKGLQASAKSCAAALRFSGKLDSNAPGHLCWADELGTSPARGVKHRSGVFQVGQQQLLILETLNPTS